MKKVIALLILIALVFAVPQLSSAVPVSKQAQSVASSASVQQAGGVLWSFGTGVPTLSDHELKTPTTAVEIDNGANVLVADMLNYRVVIIDKVQKRIIDEYTEQNVGQPLEPHDATLDWQGNIVIPNGHRNNVLIVDRWTKQVLWQYDITNPREAIEWDANTIAISQTNTGAGDGVYWVDRASKQVIKYYQTTAPLGLTKIPSRLSTNERGESVLIGHDGTLVEEVLYSNLEKIWQYGIQDSNPAEMNAYDRGMLTHWAVRIGLTAGTRNAFLTIISDNEGEKVYAVNHDKIKVWQFGQAINRNRPLPHNINLITPHGISLSPRGTLYITDSYGNRIYEVSIDIVPKLPDYNEGIPVWNYLTTDTWAIAGQMQIMGYKRVAVKLWNYDEVNSLDYSVLALIDSYGVKIWAEEYKTLAPNSSDTYDIPRPASLLQIKAKSTVNGMPAKLRVWTVMDK